MNIKFYSDTICGWCFIGHSRLKKAISSFSKINFNIEHVPFQLNPDMPLQGIDRRDYLNLKFGGPENAQPMYDHMKSQAQTENLNFNLNLIKKTPNTIKSHILIKFSEKFDLQEQIKEQIFTAYFIKGKDIGDQNILLEIAKSLNLNIDHLSEEFSKKENFEKINSYIPIYQSKGIHGVPYFEINNKAISGAQSTENIIKVIQSIV